MAGKKGLLIALLAFGLAGAGSLVLHRDSLLHDTDAYYHLAIARLYAEEGMVRELPQLRFSLLRDGFGDKELLFHGLLAPLVSLTSDRSDRSDRSDGSGADAVRAGRIALALLAGLAAAVVAGLASRVLGWWAVALPLWLFYASTELAWRMVRLRPELLSLVLLLVAMAAVATGRARLLGLVAFLYAWSYTAFQALLGLVALCFALFSWSRPDRRPARWEWPLVLYSVLGAGLALLLHPHFPANLEVWIVQNVEYFVRKQELDVGTEIRPNFSDVVLMVQLGWFAGLAALGAASRRDPDLTVTEIDRRLADAFAVATLAFGLLYVLMSRFSIYFFPFATLWWLFELRRRGRRLGAWCALPVRGRIPLAVALVLCLAASWPEARRQWDNYHGRTAPGPADERLRDRQALSAAIAPGARVAADWGPTATLMLWAPQGRYLNVLDPVFMATPYPEAHDGLESILAGEEPDVPAATAALLRSDHLLFRSLAHPELAQRLRDDPRVELLHRGADTLVRFRPAPGSFVLDWRRVPEGVETPFDPALEPSSWPSARRSMETPAPWAALEAYVDAEGLAPEARCVRFARDTNLEQQALAQVALAPYGPTSVWIDGRLAAAVKDELEAVLGQGLRLALPLTAGRHRVLVETCEGRTGQHKGFYWQEGKK